MYRGALFGVVISMAAFSLVLALLVPKENVKPVEAPEPKGNFEVVDTYRGCDVVRYTVPIEAKYHYFLDCTDSMRNK